MNTYIPQDLQQYIDDVMGDKDYAPYVLDGQTNAMDDEEFHDVLILAEEYRKVEVVKFLKDDEGRLYHYMIATVGAVRIEQES